MLTLLYRPKERFARTKRIEGMNSGAEAKWSLLLLHHHHCTPIIILMDDIAKDIFL
jgi:hypothetical protein